MRRSRRCGRGSRAWHAGAGSPAFMPAWSRPSCACRASGHAASRSRPIPTCASSRATDFDAMVREVLEDTFALFSLSAFRKGIARQPGNRPPPLARLEFLRSRAEAIVATVAAIARSPRHYLARRRRDGAGASRHARDRPRNHQVIPVWRDPYRDGHPFAPARCVERPSAGAHHAAAASQQRGHPGASPDQGLPAVLGARGCPVSRNCWQRRGPPMIPRSSPRPAAGPRGHDGSRGG